MEIKKSIFRAYDIRGRYPQEIDEGSVSAITRATVKQLKPRKVLVGHDSRLSSPSLYRTAVHSLKIGNWKLEIINAGLITTPMLYFLVNHFKADLGIMVTASHNPKDWNGLKIVKKRAVPVNGKEVYKMVAGSK